MAQEGDILLFQTNDGGEITVENGLIEMSGGLATAAYLSLFGGNKKDDGRTENPFNWWGNRGETDPAKHIRSETQNLLQGLALSSAALLQIEDAVKRDLQWMINEGAASSISVEATIPGLNKLLISVSIEAVGEESNFRYVANWEAET